MVDQEHDLQPVTSSRRFSLFLIHLQFSLCCEEIKRPVKEFWLQILCTRLKSERFVSSLMDNEERSQRIGRPPEPEFVLQWGKRLRCVRGKNPNLSSKSNCGIRRRTTSRFVSGAGSDQSRTQSDGFARGSDTPIFRPPSIDGRKSVSPEKEERYYTTRGSLVGGGGGFAVEENRKSGNGCGGEDKGVGDVGGGDVVWPKLCITLSNKEKEEDFLAMKGCKLPHRPKKRAKLVQRTLLLVSPGAWLSDLCQERYEVRERKTSKKRSKGLKAMGGVDSDSE